MKHIKMTIALVLALAIAFVMPLQSMAAGSKYVSEVYVAYGKDAAAAKKTLEDKGFTPVEGNLNDGGNTYAMMGYQTTDYIHDSITDLAVMNMRGSYSVEQYKQLLRSQKTQIAEFLNEFMTVIREYRANLKAGKTKAVYVHDLLNNYKDDDTGMPMGDLLNSETLQDKVGVAQSIEAENPDKLPDLVTILLQGNAQVIKSMETLLSMATDTADNSWLDRFAATDYDTLLDAVEDEHPDLNTEARRMQYLDNVYGETSEELGLAAVDLRNHLCDYEVSGLTLETATDEDIQNAFGNINEDAQAAVQYQDWLSIGLIYEGLKNYEGGNFAAGELLDFFLDDNDPEDTEIFIPMAAALSEGQRYGLPFVSFTQLLTYAFTDEDGWKRFAEENKTTFDGLDEVSVYQNIDRGLYADDGSVALTDAAQRANNTAAGTTGTEEEQLDTFAKIAVISWAATAGCMLVTLGTFITRSILVNSATSMSGWQINDLIRTRIFAKTVEYNVVLDYQMTPEMASKVSTARFAVQLSRIFTVVTLAVAVISAVLTIIDLCRDKTVEQLPIPKYLVDNYTDVEGGSYSLNYKAVECNREEYFGADYKKQKGSCADLLADEGKQWLVLYASKNSKAGKPLTPDFVVQTSSKAPNGYDGFVHLIGEKGATNVVSNAFKHYSTASQTWQNITGDYTMYVFYKHSNDVKTYDESAGNMKASAISSGKFALFGFGGLALGAVLGAVATSLVKKKKIAEA